MAGDWIKMRGSLNTHPKVLLMAGILMDSTSTGNLLVEGMGRFGDTVTRDVTRDVVIASLLRVWSSVNEHTSDGVMRGMTISDIDSIAGIGGFGEAMEHAGWATMSEDGKSVVFHDFMAHNTPSKSRAAERQKRYRERSKTHVTRDVTRDVTRYASVTHREEKRREEKIKNKEGENTIPPVVEKSSTPETETEESNNVPTAKPCKWKCSMTGEELARKTFAMLQDVHGWQPDPSEVRFWGAQIDRALKCTGILKDAGEYLWFIGEYPKHADNPHFPQITKAYDIVDKLPKWNAYFKRGVA